MDDNILNNPIFETVKVGNKMLPFLKTKRYVLKETGSFVNKTTVNFHKNHLVALMNTLSSQSFTSAKPIELSASQSGCYMDVATSEDGQFAAVRLFEYVPFTFQPVNDMYRFDGKVAVDFAAYLTKCKAVQK
ncbi:MAG: hypothetical protein LBR50_05050 [Tannerella sp.]|jgi:hypothetical protein|nr:hypothetical protein [Tannerella sp.]